ASTESSTPWAGLAASECAPRGPPRVRLDADCAKTPHAFFRGNSELGPRWSSDRCFDSELAIAIGTRGGCQLGVGGCHMLPYVRATSGLPVAIRCHITMPTWSWQLPYVTLCWCQLGVGGCHLCPMYEPTPSCLWPYVAI